MDTQNIEPLKDIVRKSLQKTSTASALDAWFEPLRLEADTTDALLTVFFPHAHFEDWFSQQGKTLFESCVQSVWQRQFGTSVRICYSRPPMPPTATFFSAQASGTARSETEGEYSLSSFIPNKKNEFPLAAAKEVCNPQSAHSYNPFIVCGKSGTGKTHILRALAAALTEIHGQNNVFSGNADAFAAALDSMGARAFLQSYTAVVVDDMQRMARTAALQEKYIQIIDTCLDTRRQMVFASTIPPAALEGLAEGLRSRLEVGLLVDLKEPDIDVRMRFAQARIRQYGVKLDRDHLLLLAQRCANIRHLSGIILKIAAFHSLARRDLTTADLENILRSSGEERPVTADDIISTVSEHTAISVRDILGSRRQPACVRARQTAMFLCRELLGMSYPALGRLFGGKDHSTVIHSIQKIKELMDTHKDMHTTVTELKKKCLSR